MHNCRDCRNVCCRKAHRRKFIDDVAILPNMVLLHSLYLRRRNPWLRKLCRKLEAKQ